MSIESLVAKQRYGRKIAFTADELDEFLRAEQTCRVATVSNGVPHVTPLWFAWHDEAIWLYSLHRSKRWKDITGGGPVSILVDTGHEFVQLRGVELVGHATVVGEVPRAGEPDETLTAVERVFADKYSWGDQFPYDGRHAWLRFDPETVRSWDHRKWAGV